MATDKIDEILINNKNKYNQGIYSKKHEHMILSSKLKKMIELNIVHYFEVTLLNKVSNDSTVAIGVTTKPYPYFRLPGWNKNSGYLIIKNSNHKKSITIQIEYFALGQYNERKKNIIYESLSWLISQQSKKLLTGSFILKVVPNINNKDVKILLTSNILPEIDHEISIEYKRKIFNIKYKIPENKNNYKKID